MIDSTPAERLLQHCDDFDRYPPLTKGALPVLSDIRALIAENERMATIYENAVRLSVTDCERVIEIGKRHFEASVVDGAESMLAIVEMMSAEIDRLRGRVEKLEATLVSRHGGEPLSLLSELDAAREENERLRAAVEGVVG